MFVGSAYEEVILPAATDQRFRGDLAGCTSQATVRNATCGDEVQLGLWINETEMIVKARCCCRGCIMTRAGAVLLCEYLTDKPVEVGRKLTALQMLQLLQVSLLPRRRRCALLGWEALQQIWKNG